MDKEYYLTDTQFEIDGNDGSMYMLVKAKNIELANREIRRYLTNKIPNILINSVTVFETLEAK